MQIKRFAHAVIARAIKRDPGGNETTERIGQRRSSRIKNGEVIKACRPRRRRACSFALPRIQADVMMIAAGRDKGGLAAVTLLQLEPENAAVEIQGALEIRHLEVHVPDPHAGINRVHPANKRSF